MDTSIATTNVSIKIVAYGAPVDYDTLVGITDMLKPDWDKLDPDQQHQAKALAASVMMGSDQAKQDLAARIEDWFPGWPWFIPAPGPVFDTQSVAVGLIIIGIGIMLL